MRESETAEVTNVRRGIEGIGEELKGVDKGG